MKLGRRSFFKAFGSAILGTAIALQLPDNLVPRGISSAEFKDAFAQLIYDFWFTETPFQAWLRTKVDV